MDLTGKRALITGGTKGIGASIALDLASQGVDVAINGRTVDGPSEKLAEAIEQLGQRCFLVPADMSRANEAQRCVEEAVEQLGGLDILVHSAGGPAGGNIEEISAEAWSLAFDVHVHAVFHLCRAALPALRRNNEGAIVLISSAAAIRGCPDAIAYGTVKGAVLQFTRMLARDLADENIRVNCVSPGIIRTRFHEKMTSQQQKHNLANRIPLHREGSPQDVADVVRLLVTNEFMTGESVTVDGGMTMQMVR